MLVGTLLQMLMLLSQYICDEMKSLQLVCVECTSINSVYSSVSLEMFQVQWQNYVLTQK
jgi:hypothetical protein